VRDGFQNLDKHLDEQDFFNLTNSNPSTNEEAQAGIEEARPQAQAVSVVVANTAACRETKIKDSNNFEYNNTDDGDDNDDDDLSFPPEEELDDNEEQKQQMTHLGHEQASSKYFSKKISTRNPRRVTLDACTSPLSCLGIPSAESQKSKSIVAQSVDVDVDVPVDDAIASSPETRYEFLYPENDWELDECIDDPEEELEVVKPRPVSQIDDSFAKRIKSSLPQAQQESSKPSRSKSSKRSSIGSFFKQQEKFATELKRSTQCQPKTRTQQLPAVPVPRSKPRSKPKANDFFSPERYSKRKKIDSATNSSSHRVAGKKPSACILFNKRNLTSQLNLKRGQSQSSEDYVWNGTP